MERGRAGSRETGAEAAAITWVKSGCSGQGTAVKLVKAVGFCVYFERSTIAPSAFAQGVDEECEERAE